MVRCSQVLREIIFDYLRISEVEIAAKERPRSPYLARAVHISGCDSNAPTLRGLPGALPREHCRLLLPQGPKTKGRKEYRVYSTILCVTFPPKATVAEGYCCIFRYLLSHTLRHRSNIPQVPFTPHKQQGPLNSVLLCMCNTNLASKILMSYVFNTTWGKVPQMCFSQARYNMQEGCSKLFTSPVDTHFWLASICSRAESAEVPFFPMGGPDCSREWVGMGPAICKPFMADPF